MVRSSLRRPTPREDETQLTLAPGAHRHRKAAGADFPDATAGAALGAASGAIGRALTDVGLDDKWMKETAAAIQPNTAALFVLVRKVTADKVLEGLKGEGGIVMKTSLDHTKEAALQAARPA